MERYTEVGWYLVCTPKSRGEQEIAKECSRNPHHRVTIDGSFCPICGSKTKSIMEEVFASISDAYNEESYLGEELSDKIQGYFFYPDVSFGSKEIVIPSFDGLFSVDTSSGEELTTFDPYDLHVDFDSQRQMIKVKIKELLKKIYDNVEIKFGVVTYWL